MAIEFDPAKDARNIESHGISLAAAETLLAGRTVERIDDRRDYGEVRIIAIGEVDGREFVCVYTRRGELFGRFRCGRRNGGNGMSIAKRETHNPDWAALDALSDEEIDRQIAANPDAAPDVSNWSLDDDRVVVMEPVDVKAIRAKLGMSQEEFAKAFSLTVTALRDWEQQRRAPRGPARALLQIIDREPAAARRALQPRHRRKQTAG